MSFSEKLLVGVRKTAFTSENPDRVLEERIARATEYLRQRSGQLPRTLRA